MKIDNSYVAGTSPQPPRQAAKTPPPATSGAGESVRLSALAGAIQTNHPPAPNTARIQEIKEAIAEGRFRIDPEAIADSLLESARDLVSRQRQA